MRPIPILIVFVLALVGRTNAQEKLLTLEQVSGRGTEAAPSVSFSPSIESWRWALDGVHLVRGRGDDARWVDPVTWKESAPPKDAAGGDEEPEVEGFRGRRFGRPQAGRSLAPDERAELERALVALDGVDEKLAKRIASGRARTSEDGAARLVDYRGELFFHRAGGAARRLAPQEGHELLDLAPDGTRAAYVYENDLWVIDTASGQCTALTTSGDDEHLNGKLDWVYQEEVYGRGNFKAFWWSPDSRHVAFLYLDESAVHEFTVVDHIEDGHFRVKPEVVNYPKVGDPNPTVKLGIADAEQGSVAWVDLAPWATSEPLVVRVEWTPDGARCLFVVQDRIQSWADLVAADPSTGAAETWIHERSKSWVDRPASPRWLADGSFLWQSERTGFSHLYHYRQGGELVRAVTRGDWTLGRILELSEERGELVFTCSEGGAVNGNVYRVGLDGTGFARLTRGEGQHSVDFNTGRTLFIDRVSSLADPGELRLCSADGEVVKVLARASVPAAEEYPSSAWELFEVPAPDGFPLDVAVMKPVPFDAEASHPVWISTYSGPDSPSVRNRWSSSGWERFLAQQGVVQMKVNVRSASGKGHWAIEQCYRRLGVTELADLVAAVDWLTESPWADAARVGITGYSYGGFMTAYALCGSDRFALGIAGGGVYDWRMYDTIYTERYMGTSQDNPEGYAATSCLARAKDLHGHLYMYHGVMDDNVHVQNLMQMAYALQKAGKDFEMMVYPQNRHGIRDRDQSWFEKQKEWALMREYLGAGRRTPALEAAAATTAAAGE